MFITFIYNCHQSKEKLFVLSPVFISIYFSSIMTTFTFNFSDNKNNELLGQTKDKIEWLKSDEVIPDLQMQDLNVTTHAKMFTCGEVEIGHILVSDACVNMCRGEPKNALELPSDLVTGEYEGGFKIWECTYDLIEYLTKNMDKIQLKGAKVLDLGCGAGILGIYAFMNGAFVTFQDYNKEVLENATIPNILLNIEEEDRECELKKIKFYSGDWGSFNDKLNSEVYDVILTSETIYNLSNYDKLIDLFTKRLSKNGAIYVAAKTYYFGVGGGIRQFESIIQKNGTLKSEVCWKTSTGIHREILKVTQKF